MRICSPHCGISPETNLGGEVYERQILKALSALGVEFDIFLTRNQVAEDLPNWHIHRLPISRGLRWYFAPFVIPKAVGRLYKMSPFDILRVHSLRWIGPAALLARWRYRLPVPIVAHHHHLDPDPLNSLIEKRVVEAVDMIITGSEFSRRQLIDKLGIDGKNIRITPYGISEEYRPKPKDTELARRLGLEGKKVLLFLGGLLARKDPNLILTAFRIIIGDGCHDDLRLVFVGEGELRPKLERRARDLGLHDRVIFTGFVPEEDKSKYYNLADVFVFSSQMEGFGFVVGEAMSCAIPVVVSSAGSLPELVGPDGKLGLLAQPGDAADFAAKIEILLKNDALRHSTGEAARRSISERFRWKRAAVETLKIYEEVLENGKSYSA